MSAIDKELVRSRISVSEYACRMGLELTRQSGGHRGRCPLCPSKSADAFSITGDQVWHCHACKAGGDVFTLCQLMEGLDFPAALKRLASIAGVDASEAAPTPPEPDARKGAILAAVATLAKDGDAQRAKERAVKDWAQLDRASREGLDYLRRRGVESQAAEVRFTADQVCAPLYDSDGRIVNVSKRRITDDEPRLLCLGGCTTKATYGEPRRVDETEGPVIIVEGFFDWLSARVLAPDRAVLGAHNAGRLPDVAEFVAEKCIARDLVFVPHKDTNQVGARQTKKAIKVALERGMQPERIRIFDVGPGSTDLNDYLRSLVSVEGNPLDVAPTLAELDGRRCFALTDAGNAARFAHIHRERFRYVVDMGRWLGWDGKSWETAQGKVELVRAAIEVTDHVERDAVIAEPGDPKMATALRAHAHKMQSEARLSAMVSLARAMPELGVTLDELDRDPYLLVADNGTIDLRTGELRPHRREDLITGRSPVAYDPDAKCPRWERFLSEVFEPNPDAIEFVQRYAGYSLTGDTSAQCLLFAHGNGENGKGVLFRAIEKMLGPRLVKTAPFTTFLRQPAGNRPTNDLAMMRGARVVMASEGDQDARFDEALLKTLTGGDTITARFLHQEFFEYRPTFKLWLASNPLPKIKGTDHAIWRRIKLVPFQVCFEGRRDPNLEADLERELPGILAWAVRGCLAWHRDGGGLKGLGEAPSVDQGTESYREESDLVGRFLAECCVANIDGIRTKKSVVYAAYKQWAERGGHRPMSNVWLGRELKRRGFPEQRTAQARFYPLGLLSCQPED